MASAHILELSASVSLFSGLLKARILKAERPESMIFAIWPRFRNIPNHLPASANITTGFMISYFIYFLVCLPFHYIPPHQVRWFFTIKSVTTPIAGFAIIGWILSETGEF